MTSYNCPECNSKLKEVKPSQHVIDIHKDNNVPLAKYFICNSGKHEFNSHFQEQNLQGLEGKLLQQFLGEVIRLDEENKIIHMRLYDDNNIPYVASSNFSKFSFECKEGDFFKYQILQVETGEVFGTYELISPKKLSEKDYKEVDELLSKLRKDDY